MARYKAAHWVAPNNMLVMQPPLPGAIGETKTWHLFLSHTWQYGQDQTRNIYEMLTVMAPGLRMWLDVKELDSTGNLAKYVKQCEAFLLFLTTGYFASKFCRQELAAAHTLRRKIVIVREADNYHGGGDLVRASRLEAEIAEAQAKGDVTQAELDAMRAVHDRVAAGDSYPWTRRDIFQEDVLTSIVQDVVEYMQKRIEARRSEAPSIHQSSSTLVQRFQKSQNEDAEAGLPRPKLCSGEAKPKVKVEGELLLYVPDVYKGEARQVVRGEASQRRRTKGAPPKTELDALLEETASVELESESSWKLAPPPPLPLQGSTIAATTTVFEQLKLAFESVEGVKVIDTPSVTKEGDNFSATVDAIPVLLFCDPPEYFFQEKNSELVDALKMCFDFRGKQRHCILLYNLANSFSEYKQHYLEAESKDEKLHSLNQKPLAELWSMWPQDERLQEIAAADEIRKLLDKMKEAGRRGSVDPFSSGSVRPSMLPQGGQGRRPSLGRSLSKNKVGDTQDGKVPAAAPAPAQTEDRRPSVHVDPPSLTTPRQKRKPKPKGAAPAEAAKVAPSAAPESAPAPSPSPSPPELEC